MFSLRFICTSFIFALLSFPVIAWVWFDHLNGGDQWRQGDWLINFGDGPVRRGLIGESLIAVSDATGISLLTTTQSIQTLFFLAAVLVLWLIALRCSTPLLIALFGLSPAFFMSFFAANPIGSMRKEYFGVLALGLLVLGSGTKRRAAILPVIALIIYSIGCIGNVLHALMLPIVIAGFHLLYKQGRMTAWSFAILAVLATSVATLSLAYAITFKEINDLSLVCTPLTQRGLQADICNGAIRWLVAGEVDHRAELLQRLTIMTLLEFSVVVLLSLVPLWLARNIFAEKRLLVLIACICFVPLLPLYATATDWSRWLSLSYTATVLLLIQAHTARQLTLIRLPDTTVVTGIICVSLLVAPEHSIGLKLGGAAFEIVRHILIFV